MGVARKANVDSVATGPGGDVDMSAIIRQAVATEIERQKVGRAQRDAAQDVDSPGDEG